MKNQILAYDTLVSPFNQSKILLHAEKLNELKERDVVTPVCCEIDLVDGFCNNKCKHCFFGTNKKEHPVFIDTERVKSLLDELKSMGVKAVELSGGGKPTTHPDIKEIVKHAYNLGLNLGLVTNGYLLDRLEGCYSMFTFIRISLDAATAETYEQVHGVNYFDTVIANAKRVIASGCGSIMGIGYLITGSNNEDIVEAARLTRELGCRFIQYRPASLETPIPTELWHAAKDLVAETMKFKSDEFQIFDAGIKWGHIDGERKYERCTTSSLVAVVKANGDVPMCVLKRNDLDSMLGNIYYSSFKDIFFSEHHNCIIRRNNLNLCRKPCKHDSYNIMQEAIANSYLHENFI